MDTNLKLIITALLVVITIGLTIWVMRLMLMPLYGPNHFVGQVAKKKKLKKKALREEYKEFFAEALQHCEDIKEETSFVFVPYLFSLNGLAMGTDAKHTVSFTPVWVKYLLTNPRTWKTAFMESLGHEVGHRCDVKKGKGFYNRKKEDRRYFRWAQEIKNDYMGIAFVMHFYEEISRKSIVNCIERKAEVYEKQKTEKQRKKISNSHPFWSQRIALLNKYPILTEDVFIDLAKMAGCEDKDYIEQVAKETIAAANNAMCRYYQ